METSRRLRSICFVGLIAMVPVMAMAEPVVPNPEWTWERRYRIMLRVDPRGRTRSNSPASVELENVTIGTHRIVDEDTIEVVAMDDSGRPRVMDPSGHGAEKFRVPHRMDPLFNSDKVTLSFVMPDHTCLTYAVYFDSLNLKDPERNARKPNRYHGLVGDGDFFRGPLQKRAIAASHFDQFVDFDQDGDLDLFQGGVEPYVYCFENLGMNRLVPRGRLATGGRLFMLPCSKDNRSWVTVAFYDIDRDGDQDFIPSFGDGPDAGTFVLYKNNQIGSVDRGYPRRFDRVDALRTASGELLASGKQAGGWFPSIHFLRDWDGPQQGRLDAIVGSNHRCWLYRGATTDRGKPPQFENPIALQAGGEDIVLINPRFDSGDIDGDSDLDLLAGTQPGPIWLFENVGTRAAPKLAAGKKIAVTGKFLIGDAHSAAALADFDRDGKQEIVVGRFWQRTDLDRAEQPREFSTVLRNPGVESPTRFAVEPEGGPHTEQFQICDAVRQNCVRAVDWDRDGKLDLLAGDTDGFIWLFRNQTGGTSPLFASGEKLRAGGRPLSVASTGGHARFDVCDWNHDRHSDLLVADGQGTLTLFPGSDEKHADSLMPGEPMLVDGAPIQVLPRASVLVCDWDHDGKKDVVLAGDRTYRWHRNEGTEATPVLAASREIQFSGRSVKYVRPNLGSFVDWDGDGNKDFIGCHFENSIRLYRDIGSGAARTEPLFQDEEGEILVRGSSPQMISGVDAVDWNGDGDVDLLTGQGHGGSGLRFFERDWIEDELNGTHPIVKIIRFESFGSR